MSTRAAGPVTLVVGARGLLGSAVTRSLILAGRGHVRADVPWGQPDLAVGALVSATRTLIETGVPWRVMWCAGAGVIGTTQSSLDQELATLDGYLSEIRSVVPKNRSDGAMFLASSAGGAYAASLGSPFTEATAPVPNSPYGHAKLESERLVTAFAEASGTPSFIGRVANMYGPGQDTSKPQGLISQLCRAHLERRPISIYVPLDTARDYLYVDDAARLAVAGTNRISEFPRGEVKIKILASQRGTTVASILGELRRITRRRPLVILGESPLAKFQVRDLRFRSRVWPDIDDLVVTSLPAGISATMQDLGFVARTAPRR